MDHRSRPRAGGDGDRRDHRQLSGRIGAVTRGGGYPRPILDGRSDTTLVAAARTGDANALDTLLRRHHDRLYAVCRRLAGNDADAQDACQEALILIVRNLDHFDGRAAFSTWAYRVATNACLDELRRRRRRPVPIDRDSSPEPAGSVDEIDQATTRLDLETALGALGDDHRVAVVLRDVAGLSYAEIADILGVATGTVRSRIARGREALIPHLDDDGGNHDPRAGRRT